MSDQERLLQMVAAPPASMLYFGADPAWSPKREGEAPVPDPLPDAPAYHGRRVRRDQIRNTRRFLRPDGKPRDRCQNCLDGDNLAAYETVDNVCATCLRSHYDGQHTGVLGPSDPENPSYRLQKVAGKTDPRLSIYTRPEPETGKDADTPG